VDWRGLVDKYGPALFLYARQLTRSAAAAEEAVQEGFVRFWRAGPRDAADPAPLLYTAVRQSAIDRYRSEVRRKDRELKAGEWLYNEPTLFETSIEQDERRGRIERALQTLPAEQREVLIMKIWGELTFRQIAESLAIPPNTAASRYRYALDSLRREIGDEGF
jgi:RNA polymerase sigma-70 factor, ECF subfamily